MVEGRIVLRGWSWTLSPHLSNATGCCNVNGDISTFLLERSTFKHQLMPPTPPIFRLSDDNAGTIQDSKPSRCCQRWQLYVFNLAFTDAANVAADAPAFTTDLPTGTTFTVNVESEAVPEPASLGILAFGSLGLLIRKRRSNA